MGEAVCAVGVVAGDRAAEDGGEAGCEGDGDDGAVEGGADGVAALGGEDGAVGDVEGWAGEDCAECADLVAMGLL